jgi:hypothetical protein
LVLALLPLPLILLVLVLVLVLVLEGRRRRSLELHRVNQIKYRAWGVLKYGPTGKKRPFQYVGMAKQSSFQVPVCLDAPEYCLFAKDRHFRVLLDQHVDDPIRASRSHRSAAASSRYLSWYWNRKSLDLEKLTEEEKWRLENF